MFQTGKWAVAVALVGTSVWAGFALTAQESKPAAGAQPADLTALREAVTAAAKRGENVDEVRKALAALEKALPGAKPGAVPAELRALRDAVEAAAKKGENVGEVQKELAAVELSVAGRTLAPPKPAAPPADLPVRPNPFNPPALPLPPDGAGQLFPGRIDPEAFQRANDLHMRALELLAKDPDDPEARKLLTEANNLMLKSLMPNKNLGVPNGAGELVFPDLDRLPNMNLPDLNRAPDRVRLGIKLEKLSPIVAEQLGLEPDVGVAVAGVVPGSAAEQAGLKVHDIVVEFAGKPASGNAEEFIRQVGAAKAGEKINLVVVRKGKKVEIKGVLLPDLGRPVVAPLVAPVPLPDRVPRAKSVPLPAPPVPERSVDVVDIRADAAPAKVDLGDLRDAIAAAEKRGENVDEIRKAYAALEKVLAKGAVKPGDAPPELPALRDAVEGAAKKGENVGAISKELGAIEKALTGREYERPKVEEPKPEFPRRPGGFGPNPGGRVVIGGGRVSTTSVVITNNNFVIQSRTNDVTYTVTGTLDAAAALKITIKDGDKTVEADELKKVPEEYRAHIERLLKSVNR